MRKRDLGGQVRDPFETSRRALRANINIFLRISPELAYDRTRDWSVYALDPLEEVPMPTHPVTPSSSESTQRGVMTGMGLISHAFAEVDGINNPLSVTGKIIEDNGNESLEVVLRLQEVCGEHPHVS